MSNGKKIFFSYAREDQKFVDVFSKTFRREKLQVWIDREDIGYGKSIVESINNAIQECRHSLIFYSRSYAEKSWTREESRALFYALLEDEDRETIVIKLDDHPLPPLFSHRLWRDSLEPDLLAKWFEGQPINSSYEQSIKFDELISAVGPLNLTAFAKRICDELGKGNTQIKLTLPRLGAITLCCAEIFSEELVLDIVNDIKICDIHSQFIRGFKKELSIDGLGVFRTSFEIRLNERLGFLDRDRQKIVSGLEAIILDIFPG